MIQISEFVGQGHPDRLADNLAEAITSSLTKEEGCRVSIDVLITQGMVAIAGEVTTGEKKGNINKKIKNLTALFLEENGYKCEEFDIHIKVREQSKEIKEYSKDELGNLLSGDQSVVYGYACNSRLGTGSYMPESWELARKVIARLRGFKWAKPDSKCLVVLNKVPDRLTVDNLVVSVHHFDEVDLKTIRSQILEEVIKPLFEEYQLDELNPNSIHINSAGKFTVGGLAADSGATNRKLMADSYGCSVPHGGGGYNGKDLTKVDRLGAYFARYICKNIVAAGVCDELELGLFIRPGADKFEFFINRVNGSKEIDWIIRWKIRRLIREVFDYRFEGIHKLFFNAKKGLKFALFSNWGHFGESGELCPWESLDKVEEIQGRVAGYKYGL